MSTLITHMCLVSRYHSIVCYGTINLRFFLYFKATYFTHMHLSGIWILSSGKFLHVYVVIFSYCTCFCFRYNIWDNCFLLHVLRFYAAIICLYSSRCDISFWFSTRKNFWFLHICVCFHAYVSSPPHQSKRF